MFPREGDTIGGTSYGAVAVSDASVTEVWYNILDSDASNDGDGNGAGNWEQAAAVTVPTQIGASGFTKEWRLEYRKIPSSGTATLRVRFKEASSADDLSMWEDASGPLSVATEDLAFEWLDDGSTTGGLPAEGVRRVYRIEISMP